MTRYLTAALLLAGMMNTASAQPPTFMTEVSLRPPFEYEDNHIALKPNKGGDIDSFAAFFALIEKSGEPVWVMGMCLSACTLVLRNPKACAMPTAVFGFHSASLYNKQTLETLGVSDHGNRLFWAHYPEKVKTRLGGRLSEEMVYLRGTELLPPCKPVLQAAPQRSGARQAATESLLPALSGWPLQFPRDRPR
jgi:hypothetical protein